MNDLKKLGLSFKNWTKKLTFNDVLKDFIDTLFVIIFIIAVLYMYHKSGQCVATFTNEIGEYEKINYKLEYTNYQAKAFNILLGFYFFILPSIIILYGSFILFFEIWKDLNKRSIFKIPELSKNEFERTDQNTIPTI